MNNKNDWQQMQHIKAPDELKARTLAAARAARREAMQDAPQHLTPAPRRRWGMAKRILATACAFGIAIGGTAVWRSQQTGVPASDAVAATVAHSFGIVAYAADTGETMAPKDSQIVFDDGAGVNDPEKGFFSGCVFRVTGEDIQSVRASMDKGGLYRTKRLAIDEADTAAMLQGTDPRIDGADEVSVSGLPDQSKCWADLSWQLGDTFEEAYDPDASYGFWAPYQAFDPDMDLSLEWHTNIDYFEGATLRVTVTFTDGTQQTRTMTLHTGRLAVCYPDETSGPQLTGEVLTEEQGMTTPYTYGVYAALD
ncbi:MAG: hypothetical protein Q4D31_02615 [Eubacteriales bacterium]|nr:hypothetical protein [Eubacteriales bacterium]